MEYRCELDANGEGGFLVRFPDVPEALTEGATRQQATVHASDALEVALLGRMKGGDDLPPPSYGGGAPVPIAAQAAAKLAFYSAFRRSGLSQSALARKLGKDEAEVRRMLDPYHATKLPALDEALRALGQRLVVSVEAA